MNALLTGMEWLPDLPGGLNRYFHGLVQSLPSMGVGGTALVSYLASGPTVPAASPRPIRVLPMAAQGSSLLDLWRGGRELARRGLTDRPDLVNVHFALYALSILRTLPADVPLVVHFHGPWADETAAERGWLRGGIRRLVARRIELAVYRRATRLITLSHAFARLLAERYAIPQERIRVVPGGVDLQPFFAASPRSEARRKLGWSQDRPIVLAVRRLVRRVGLESLIDAMQQVRAAVPDVQLLVGGVGPLHDELRQRIDDAGLADHVRLLGLVAEADLPLAYAAADVSVVPSMKLEGFGLVTAESLAAGTPVLGTPVGGTPEILGALDPALVFDALTPESMADRLIASLTGKLPLPSAQRCRAHARQYDWTQVASRVRAVYQEALEARPLCDTASAEPDLLMAP